MFTSENSHFRVYKISGPRMRPTFALRQSHITNATLKANRMLGLIKRNLRHCHPRLKEKAYFSLVRPHLEYSSTVWNPHHQTTINQIEAIQKRAARFVKNSYQRTESVTAMLQDLQWPSLQSRRDAAIKIMLYKISHGLIAINKEDYLSPMTTTKLRNYNPAKFQLLTTHSTKDIYRFSFMPTAVRLWNGLPVDVITAPTVDVFRAHVSANQLPALFLLAPVYICTTVHLLHINQSPQPYILLRTLLSINVDVVQ